MNKVTLSSFCMAISFSLPAQISKVETVQSIYVETFKNKLKIGSGTGFIIKPKSQSYLVTNWHVVTNKNPQTKTWIDTLSKVSPNIVKIFYNDKKLGQITPKEELLLDSKDRRYYFEFPLGTEMVDVIALPLKDTIGNIQIFPVDYKTTTDWIRLSPTQTVFVVGFPFGASHNGFPIWKSGFISSEPQIDIDNRPIIYVDLEGIPGMSGSPVYYISKSVTSNTGKVFTSNSESTYFLGVLAGRFGELKISWLWKSTYLRDLFNSLP
jgi:hypothetical protein